MKRKMILCSILLGIIIPSFFFLIVDKIALKENVPLPMETLPVEYVPNITFPKEYPDYEIPVLLSDGNLINMNLEQYLVGVLLGEMPMDFAEEALKAQSVVARTYTLRRNLVSEKHEKGAVCTDSFCCQSFCSPESYLAKGGSVDSLQKAQTAVDSTRGVVIMYDGALIEATYFSCSGGRTEDAVAVWGTDIPYLQAVDSPGEETATHYEDSVSFNATEFSHLLGLRLSGEPSTWFGTITYTDGGGVNSISIGGTIFKGTQLREKLDIRSTAFTIKTVGNIIYITTRGFGHRVGMSQYGAEAMAVKGNVYQEILSHYYPGTEVVKYNRN